MGKQKRFHALDVLNEVKKHEEAKRIKKLQIKQQRALKEKQLESEEILTAYKNPTKSKEIG